jgi:hypothetical protein
MFGQGAAIPLQNNPATGFVVEERERERQRATRRMELEAKSAAATRIGRLSRLVDADNFVRNVDTTRQ